MWFFPAERRGHSGSQYRQGMRVLMIGGTGSIGPYVVAELAGQGHSVTVFHRGESEAPMPESVRHVRSPDAATPVVRFPREVLEPAPDIVIHMIPMGEDDTCAAVEAFRGRAGRLVAISSGDVYLAYGRLTGIEPGPLEPGLLREDSPLRSVLYPYRAKAKSKAELSYNYEKILVERIALAAPDLPAVVLRLPKVYGPGSNSNLATVYQARRFPAWRWTHGYVENVAHAIALAAVHPAAAGRIYNVGEEQTPTVGERLAHLPPPEIADEGPPMNYAQDIAYDTARIRCELGFRERVGYEEGLRRTLHAS